MEKENKKQVQDIAIEIIHLRPALLKRHEREREREMTASISVEYSTDRSAPEPMRVNFFFLISNLVRGDVARWRRHVRLTLQNRKRKKTIVIIILQTTDKEKISRISRLYPTPWVQAIARRGMIRWNNTIRKLVRMVSSK